MEEEFDNFVKTYDMNNEKIKLKYFHSYRVKKLSEEIAASINENIRLASDIGLLHDVGRFEQLKRYNTFKDLESVDHGDLGVEMLFDNKLIEDFPVEKENYSVIYNAIKNHNKKNIEDNLSDKDNIYCKIIRDADKLDIIENISDYKMKNINDDSISLKVMEEFDNEKTISNENVKNYNDSIISMLALVYDLNFKYSYIYLKEKDIINNIFNKIDNKEIFKKYFDKINKYIEGKIVC